MTGADFSLYVKAKLNRIDTSAWEDVRTEEILFFALDALKKLSLRFDAGDVPVTLDKSVINNYLSSITKRQTIDLVDNKIILPLLLKIKDAEVLVKVGNQTGVQPTRELPTERISNIKNSPLSRSFPDKPIYFLVEEKIVFLTDSTFTCEKVYLTFLEYPEEIVESTGLDMPFMSELQDETTTLIIENLENRRIQTQPAITKQ
jgi:hypothetical protein